MIRKLLVANRAEIARRVIRTAHSMGIATVAVHGDDDRGAAHVQDADEAFWLGSEADGSPYLDIGKVIGAAKATGCDAIHPGYGFLAERADFAQAVLDAGLTWVGPPPDVMAAMAEKDAAKDRAEQAGVPVLQGFACTGLDDVQIGEKAENLGFPLLIKAVAGGGGRGMRVVAEADAMVEQLALARQEAAKAFGDDRLLVERYIARGRHVEVQVFADSRGNVVHLHERECSVQRRHQKIIEESPAPTLSAALRAEICGAAARLAEAIGYVNAGTVEFLVDDERGDFAFLEVNARIQVEHPVTELRTGTDLVRWQLMVANGQALPLTQAQVVASGHAIEARLCAEDPAADHRPQAGEVLWWRPGDGARVDSAFAPEQPAAVSVHYDSMVAKVIAHAPTRDEAIAMLDRALGDTALLGLRNNRSFLRRIITSAPFVAGDTTTRFLQEHPIDAVGAQVADDTLLAAAAWLSNGGWQTRFRNNAHRPDVTVLKLGDASVHVALHVGIDGTLRGGISRDPDPMLFAAPETIASIEVLERAENTLIARINGLRRRFWLAQDADMLWIQPHLGDATQLRVGTLLPEPEVEEVPAGSVVTDSAAVVTAVHVEVGDTVDADAPLVTVEAMKMLAVLRAPDAGTVAAVMAEVGQSVAAGQVLVQLA